MAVEFFSGGWVATWSPTSFGDWAKLQLWDRQLAKRCQYTEKGDVFPRSSPTIPILPSKPATSLLKSKTLSSCLPCVFFVQSTRLISVNHFKAFTTSAATSFLFCNGLQCARVAMCLAKVHSKKTFRISVLNPLQRMRFKQWILVQFILIYKGTPAIILFYLWNVLKLSLPEKNKRERYSRCHRQSDTRYSAQCTGGTKGVRRRLVYTSIKASVPKIKHFICL